MIKTIRLLNDEGGAITIDWIGVVAGVLLLGLAAVFAGSNNGVSSVIDKMNHSVESEGEQARTASLNDNPTDYDASTDMNQQPAEAVQSIQGEGAVTSSLR